MAPTKAAAVTSPFEQGERVLCFHHDMLYEAKILESGPTENNLAFQYKIHYKGWKNTWDDWVPQDRVRKFTEENKQLATQLNNQMKLLQQAKNKTAAKKGRANGSDFSSARGSEERHVTAQGRGAGGAGRRTRDYDLEVESEFFNRPAVHIHMSDFLKAILVDDWENVTKLLLVVPLPHPVPITQILQDYHESESPKRLPGSAQAATLEDFINGIGNYFNNCLGSQLLYRFERVQYVEVYHGWSSDNPLFAGKAPIDTYGAEHLTRLISVLPDFLAQTDMDQQSINRLREEVTKLGAMLARTPDKYFVSSYENPGQAYIEEARRC